MSDLLANNPNAVPEKQKIPRKIKLTIFSFSLLIKHFKCHNLKKNSLYKKFCKGKTYNKWTDEKWKKGGGIKKEERKEE